MPLNNLQMGISRVSKAHGPSYVGLVATMCVPMGARVPVLSPRDDPNAPKSRQKVFRKSQKFENWVQIHIQRPLYAKKFF